MNYEVTVETENENGQSVKMTLTDGKAIEEIKDFSVIADKALEVFIGSFSNDEGLLDIEESQLTVKVKAIIYEDTWAVGEDI